MPVAVVAHPEFKAELKAELGTTWRQHDRLFLSEKDHSEPIIWAQDRWPDFKVLDFSNERDLAGQLLKLKSHWVELRLDNSKSIKFTKDVLYPKGRKLQFLQKLPIGKFGVFAVTHPRKAVICTRPNSPVPLGEVQFSEDRKPPNRAYLKLWELLTLHGIEPKAGDFCLDLGASPGGWTWVLQSLGCQVLAIDKAPLAPFVSKLKGVSFQKGDAFQVKLEEYPPIDWIFSDVICYPEKLLESVLEWTATDRVKNIVCTVKLKGAPDVKLWRKFQSLPDSQTKHLWHNKHELTWIWRRTKVELKKT